METMFPLPTLLLPCLSILSCIIATPIPTPSTNLANTRDIYQFPNKGTWVENLAVRFNGQIIITRLDVPQIFQVNPFTPGQPPTLIAEFPGYLGTIGIAEVSPEIFAVAVGNYSVATRSNTPKSYAVWKVDMRSFNGQPGSAKTSKITDIPEAILLNGVTLLDGWDATVLVADSGLGVVYRVDTKAGTYEIVQDDATMKATGLGVNGLRVRNGNFFFTNGGKNTFTKVPINRDGTAAGAYQTIVTNTVGSFDDFALDILGDAFAAQGGGGNQIVKISRGGVETEVAGNINSTAIAGPTSARFGRTLRDLTTLYVTTNGGLTGPVDGTIVEGGKIVAVDVPIL
ncbi:MAG: hypothetical protein OHK93_007164 [Ramalina farinacea]|uniref:Uncharacterized protein n=1 Tax=Ramalina farinacea TaxID=258253 RepID=A0AA43TQR1_9LECA|nr:hypothetical protein [Ramalina farinacea]